MKYKHTPVSAKVRVRCLCHPANTASNVVRRGGKNLRRILESFVIIPALTVAMPFGGLVGVMKTTTVPGTEMTLAAKLGDNTLGLPEADETLTKEALLKAEGEAIDAYFAARNMPLEGTGYKMAVEADKHNLDYRLIPAIAVKETTGGKQACPVTYRRTGEIGYTYNVFGWGSCKIKFNSYDHAIEVIATNLGGKNPRTEKYYSGKNTIQILQKYNPPSIVPNYAYQVIGIMTKIGKEDLTADLTKVIPNT